MTEFWNSTVTIVLAIIGIAGLALILSRQSNTTGVLTAGGGAVSNLIATAISPVTGAGSGSTIPGLPSFGGSNGSAGFLG